MADNYYDEEDGKSQENKSKDGGASSTGLLPKSVLMGRSVEVGDELNFKVTAIHGDEIQVKCDYGESEKEPEGDTTEEPDGAEEKSGNEQAMAPATESSDGMYD